MTLLCLKSLHHAHAFLRGKVKSPVITYKILENLNPMLLRPMSYCPSYSGLILICQLPTISRYLVLAICFAWKILPLGTHSLSSFTFLLKYHLLWQFYLKFYPYFSFTLSQFGFPSQQTYQHVTSYMYSTCCCYCFLSPCILRLISWR